MSRNDLKSCSPIGYLIVSAIVVVQLYGSKHKDTYSLALLQTERGALWAPLVVYGWKGLLADVNLLALVDVDTGVGGLEHAHTVNRVVVRIVVLGWLCDHVGDA